MFIDEIPDDKVIITDENVVAGNVPDESDETDDKEKVDDTTKEAVSKKEEERDAEVKRIRESNERLMKMFTSPEFFSKLAGTMRQPEQKTTKVEPTAEQIQAEKQRLEDMDRQEFKSHILSVVSEAVKAGVKPEVDKLAAQMSTFITGQAEVAGESAIKDFIDRVGQAEFDKYGAAMEAKAYATKGLSIDEIYGLVSGKKAPRYAQNRIPNVTQKPGTGLKELTEQKDLSMKEAASRNFDHIFGKSQK